MNDNQVLYAVLSLFLIETKKSMTFVVYIADTFPSEQERKEWMKGSLFHMTKEWNQEQEFRGAAARIGINFNWRLTPITPDNRPHIREPRELGEAVHAAISTTNSQLLKAAESAFTSTSAQTTEFL